MIIGHRQITDYIYILILLLFLAFNFTNNEYSVVFELLFVFFSFYYFIFNKPIVNSYILWLLLFLIISLLSLYYTQDSSQTLIEVRKVVRLLLINLSIINFSDNLRNFKKIMITFILASYILLIDILITTPSHQIFTSRLGASEFGFNANEVALIFTFAAAMLMYFSKNSRVSYILMVPLMFAVLLTGSRKAILMLVSIIVLLIISYSDEIISRIKALFFIVIIVGILYFTLTEIPFLYEIAGQRLQSLVDTFFGIQVSDGSISIRTIMISIGIDLFLNKPIFGYGIGSYATVSRIGTYAHNNYIEILVGLGILGFFIYYSYYLNLIIKYVNSNKTRLSKTLIVVFIMLTIFESSLVTYNVLEYHIVFSMTLISIKLSNQKDSIKIRESKGVLRYNG